MELEKRKQLILKAIVDDYIATAEPVGSKTIAQRIGFTLSPATIRNEMADLETMGYLEQPHTSAGRIPSPQGYRLYVNELMQKHRLSMREMETINHALSLKLQELDRVISEAGRLVARLTNYTSYILSPSAVKARIARFDLFVVSPAIFTAVLVTDVYVVKNKLIHVQPPIDGQALQSLGAALNTYLTGLCLDDITGELIGVLEAASGSGRCYLSAVLEFVGESMGAGQSREVHLTGASHILSHPEYQDSIKARELIEYLSDSDELSRLSEPEPDSPVQIIIGPENVAEQLRESSVIMASYNLGGNLRGLIGVVGPTRMDYSLVASRLSYFTERLNKMLKEEFTDEP